MLSRGFVEWIGMDVGSTSDGVLVEIVLLSSLNEGFRMTQSKIFVLNEYILLWIAEDCLMPRDLPAISCSTRWFIDLSVKLATV